MQFRRIAARICVRIMLYGGLGFALWPPAWLINRPLWFPDLGENVSRARLYFVNVRLMF